MGLSGQLLLPSIISPQYLDDQSTAKMSGGQGVLQIDHSRTLLNYKYMELCCDNRGYTGGS
jgi:hypothetical protein